MAKKKSWIEKRDGGKPSQVKECPNGFADIKPGQIMLLPSARQIDDFLRARPKGSHIDLKELRIALAEEKGAEISCPVVTGIHLRVVAEAAHEEIEAGKPLSEITPIWRAIGPKTKTLKKLSYDYTFILEQREREGISDHDV